MFWFSLLANEITGNFISSSGCGLDNWPGLNLAHYFPYDVKLRILAHSRSFLANQKARNAIFGAENLLIYNIHLVSARSGESL